MAIVTDATLGAIRDQLARRNTVLRDFVELYAKSQWDIIRLDVKSGLAPTKYPVGTILTCKYTYETVEYDFPWIVVDNNREVTWEDGTKHPGLILEAQYATIESMPFDAPENMEATEATAQEGWYYTGFDGSAYTSLNLATGATIPYSSYTKVYKNSVNNATIAQYGYNRYSMCAQRQWLNSAETRGNWWTSQHPGDVAPSQAANYDGFMRGLDADFLTAITPVKVQAATNTVTDGGGVDIMYDRFWLPSVEEMYGVPQLAGAEGPYYPYWKTQTGLNAPTNDANAGRIIYGLNAQSTALVCRLRSAVRGGAYGTWSVGTTGILYNYSAYNSYRCSPACAIS